LFVNNEVNICLIVCVGVGGGVGGDGLKPKGTDANVPTFTLDAVDPTVPKKPFTFLGTSIIVIKGFLNQLL